MKVEKGEKLLLFLELVMKIFFDSILLLSDVLYEIDFRRRILFKVDMKIEY